MKYIAKFSLDKLTMEDYLMACTVDSELDKTKTIFWISARFVYDAEKNRYVPHARALAYLLSLPIHEAMVFVSEITNLFGEALATNNSDEMFDDLLNEISEKRSRKDEDGK